MNKNEGGCHQSKHRLKRATGLAAQGFLNGGRSWIRTSEGVSQQIYSLPPLATWVSYRAPTCGSGARFSQTLSAGSSSNFGPTPLDYMDLTQTKRGRPRPQPPPKRHPVRSALE